MTRDRYYVCILSGEQISIELLEKYTPFSYEIGYEKGDICQQGRHKGSPETETSIRIVSEEIYNTDVLFEELANHLEIIKRYGVEEIYLDYICSIDRNGAVLNFSNNNLKALAKLKAALLLTLYHSK